MKVFRGAAKKVFVPVEVTVLLESKEELDAMNEVSFYADRVAKTIYQNDSKMRKLLSYMLNAIFLQLPLSEGE